jgi:hypothetical protein
LRGGRESGGFGIVGGGAAWRSGIGVGEVVDLADDVVPAGGVAGGEEEFALGVGDGLQEDFGEIGEGVGGFGGDAAFGNGGEEACDGEVEGRGGDDFADERQGDAVGSVIVLAEMTELALVVVAVFGVGERTRKAAATSIRKGKSAQRRAVFGIGGRHRDSRK